MPSISRPSYRKDPRTGNWEVNYYLQDGSKKTRKWKGGFATKYKAEIYVKDLEHQYKTGAHDRENITLRDFVTRYLESRHHKQKSSITQDRVVLTQFQETLPPNTPITAVTKNHINKHINTRKKTAALSTVARDLRTLKTFFSVAVTDNLIPENPASSIPKITVDETEIRYLTIEQQTKLLQKAREVSTETTHRSTIDAPYLYPIVAIALRTGMRKSEILNLRWSDIHTKTIHVATTHQHRTKSGRSRSVPLDQVVKDALEWYKSWYIQEIDICRQTIESHSPGQTRDRAEHRLQILTDQQESKYLFPSFENPDKPIQQFQKVWEKARKRAGTDIRFHDTRHTFAVTCCFQGVPIPLISQLLGHSDIKTTQIYMRFMRDDAVERVTLPVLELAENPKM